MKLGRIILFSYFLSIYKRKILIILLRFCHILLLQMWKSLIRLCVSYHSVSYFFNQINIQVIFVSFLRTKYCKSLGDPWPLQFPYQCPFEYETYQLVTFIWHCQQEASNSLYKSLVYIYYFLHIKLFTEFDHLASKNLLERAVMLILSLLNYIIVALIAV